MKNTGPVLPVRRTCDEGVRKTNGFTLIEIIVTVTIIMLLSGFAVVRYTEYNNRQRVKQSALDLKSNLRFAQQKAVSGQKPVTSVAVPQPCTTLEGYEVRFTETSYTVGPTCTEGTSYSEDITIPLPVGITIAEPTPDPIVFYPLNRGVSLTTDQTITLKTGLGFGTEEAQFSIKISAYSGTISE